MQSYSPLPAIYNLDDFEDVLDLSRRALWWWISHREKLEMCDHCRHCHEWTTIELMTELMID